jgi:hypothetical protein
VPGLWATHGRGSWRPERHGGRTPAPANPGRPYGPGAAARRNCAPGCRGLRGHSTPIRSPRPKDEDGAEQDRACSSARNLAAAACMGHGARPARIRRVLHGCP